MSNLDPYIDDCTKDWLQLFEQDKARNRLENNIFWKLALTRLPVGVNAQHPVVKECVEEIRKLYE